MTTTETPQTQPQAPKISAAAAAAAAHIAATTEAPSFAEYVHEFVLPSHGIPYVNANGEMLLPDGAVRVRSMTGNEEAILNSSQFSDHSKAAKIIEACARLVTTEGKRFDPRDLITTDRLVLMLVIRAFSLGAVYRAPGVCRSCQSSIQSNLDLVKDLDVQEMPRRIENADGEVVEYRYDPIKGIEYTLPTVQKQSIVLRLLTGRDEEFMYREAAKDKSPFLPPGIQGDKTYLLRIMLAIREIDGRVFEHSSVEDMKALCAFVRALPIRATQAIASIYAKYDVGIPLAFPVPCPACGEQAEVYLRLTTDFFRAADL